MSNAAQTQSIVVLKAGSTGAEVLDLQYILQIRNFNPGTLDGVFGAKTQAAVMRFQQSKNLSQDGIVGSKTWAAMGFAWPNNQPGTFLRRGDVGNAVRQMQQGLTSKGFALGAIDGSFGARTQAAVIQIQQDGVQRSNRQGVVGPLTWGGIIAD